MLREFRTQHIVWDVADKRIYKDLTAHKGDVNGRMLRVQVLNAGKVENLGGSSLSLGWRSLRYGGQGLDAFHVVDSSKGLYEIYFTTEMVNSDDTYVEASLILVTSTGRVESVPFNVKLIGSTVDDDAVQSDNSFTALTEALITVSSYDGRITQLETGNNAQNGIQVSVEEPLVANIWYEDKGEAPINFEIGSGVTVQNAILSDTEPSDTQRLWFDED